MTKKRSNTTTNNKEKKPGGITGKGFVKGDPRINRNGRPKSFDQLRALFQEIAGEEIVDDGKKRTRAHVIGIAMSKDKKLMRDFLEFAFGKVPQKLEHEGNLNVSWKEFVSGSNTDPESSSD
jgi:hypothetical protein